MSKLVVFLTLATVIPALTYAQMVPQCTCSAVEPCKNAYTNSIMSCADECQSHATAIGANYGQLRSCLLKKEPQIKQALQCAEKGLPNACASSPGHQVPKRYPETLKIAAMSEINRLLSRAGVSSQVKSLMAQGKKFYSCMRSCMDRHSGHCAKKLGCGLLLPPDNVMVQNAKQCAIRSGFGTAGVQELCRCAAASGVHQLDSVCPKLVIS